MSSHPLKPTPEGAERVKQLLALVQGRITDAVVDSCLSSAQLVGLPVTPALSTAISVYTRTQECTHQQFLEDVIRPTVVVASRFTSLFTTDQQVTEGPATRRRRTEEVDATDPGFTVSLNMPHATFSREQLWCIVANAFLCTFEERHWSGGSEEDELPTINFTEMHEARQRRNYVEITKLRLLFDYFRLIAEESRQQPNTLGSPTVTVARCRAPPLAETVRDASGRTVPSCVVHALGESIDEQNSMLRLDFANRWIGGGALSDGCVQEEITFAQCPELIALRWFHKPLNADESLVVSGYRQYSRLRPGTYGRGIRYGGCDGLPRLLDGALIAVDALDYRFKGAMPQFTPQAVERELQKLLGGLLAPLCTHSVEVAGGNWGCGVFGGDVQLKFLIQWLACGLAGKQLHYFPFDLPYVAGMQPIADHLSKTAQLDLSVLLECLRSSSWLRIAEQDGAWTAFVEWLASNKAVLMPELSSGSDASPASSDSDTIPDAL